MSNITIKFGTEYKPTKHNVVNNNFTEQDFEKEGENQPIGVCLPLSLSIFFFFFSSKIPLSYLFPHCFLFLNTCFLFPSFEIPNPLMLVSPSSVHDKGLPL